MRAPSIRAYAQVLSGNLAVRFQWSQYAAFSTGRKPLAVGILSGTGLVTRAMDRPTLSRLRPSLLGSLRSGKRAASPTPRLGVVFLFLLPGAMARTGTSLRRSTPLSAT
jgi:hypothetical protein